jgi:hypothetical protein
MFVRYQNVSVPHYNNRHAPIPLATLPDWRLAHDTRQVSIAAFVYFDLPRNFSLQN